MNEQDARTQILAAATTLFARNGFAHTSLNEIVRESGLSKGGVYWHFASKDALIEAVFMAFFQGQAEILTAVLAREGDAAAKLHRLAQLAQADIDTQLAQFPAPLEFYTLAAHSETLRQRLADFYTDYHEKLSRLLQQGIDDGLWPDSLAIASTAHVIISTFEGIILLWSLFPEQINLSQQMETATRLILAGLATG
ncbi:MAG: TetR/AcrR family transcriptional regulator [Anaerolineae bacterium]|nr:TetR/AcrR family transcriptional regulator [Anaerolineae bacterium]